MFKIGDRLKNVAVGIERLGLTNTTAGVSSRIQYNLGIDEVPGRDSVIQGLAKSRSGRHPGRGLLRSLRGTLAAPGIYTSWCPETRRRGSCIELSDLIPGGAFGIEPDAKVLRAECIRKQNS